MICRGSKFAAVAKAAMLGAAIAPVSQAFLPRTSPVISLKHGLEARRTSGTGHRAISAIPPAMSIAGPDDEVQVVVCGPREGIAGLVATRLSAAGGRRKVMIAEETMALSDQLDDAKVVVACTDGGPDGEEAPVSLAQEVAAALSPSTEYLVWVDSPEGREVSKEAKSEAGWLGGLLGKGFKTPLEAIRSVEGNLRCIIMHTGRLFGSAGGPEPVPFLTGPKAEPVLDESITRQAVLLGPGTILSAPEEAATKRSSVAEAIMRILEGPERQTGLEVSVVSVEGLAASDDEWKQELERLDDPTGVAVFSIDFEAINKRDELLAWMGDAWGPNALRKCSATMLRSGARPVAAVKSTDGVDILWETLGRDLNPVEAGRLRISVVDDPAAGIRVIRVAGLGQPQGTALTGEEEIVQSLLEGINTVAYPKSFVRRKAPKDARSPRAAKAAATGTPGEVTRGETSQIAPASAETGTTTAASPAPAADPLSEAAAAARKGRGRRSGGRRKSS